MKKFALFTFSVCLGALSAYLIVLKGCRVLPEASFGLSDDSRLPRWISLPSNIARGEVHLTMDYYTTPWGPDVGFTLKDRNGRVLQQLYGYECQPRYAISSPPIKYPNYVAVEVNGEIEMIEHKRMEPLFYVSDTAPVPERAKRGACK